MPERIPLNLKAPAKPISSKERRARGQQAAELFADLKRQAVPLSVMTKWSPWPRQLHIAVPDSHDWTLFCAELLRAGQIQWLLQGDRKVRYNNDDPSVPRLETWPAFRKALLRAGKRYWDTLGVLRSRRGRPDVFGRCLRALWKELKTAHGSGRIKYRKTDGMPLMNGRPVTQDEVRSMIQNGDPVPKGDPGCLSDKVCQKYGRLLYLAFKQPEQGTPNEHDFMKKYLTPILNKLDP